jgi:2-polyprenyl-3-methyl-5-hydroxy-6-metoxy-1,4-benzoquinol methylase
MTERAPSTQEKYPEFLEDQRQFFDELITREWDTYQNRDWDEIRRFEVNCLFRLVSPRTILDVGCGCGFHDVLMAEKAGVETVVGIDYSKKSIETANRVYPHRNVRRRVKDIRYLNAGEGFNLVVSFQVIEHLTDAVEFLKNCRRQSTPAGHVAVITPNHLRLSNRLRILTGASPKFGDPQHFREYTIPEIVALGEKAGLKYCGAFAYGMSLRIPKTNSMFLPAPIRLRLGHLVPFAADCLGVVFQNDTSS